MLDVEIQYALNKVGERIDNHVNLYADLLAGNIVRGYDPPCPENHSKYPSAKIILGIINNKVDVIEITGACCQSFKNYLLSNIKTDLKF